MGVLTLDEIVMAKCLGFAEYGMGNVAPNPMVGCFIVENPQSDDLNGEIIGHGFHEEFGKAHAEVNAINSVIDKSRLENATLYVNLEPCCHHGKTPPCTELIISSGIKKVVIGNVDSNPLVGGAGVERLKSAGIEVVSGILNEECRKLNKRFFTYHEKKRPYIILKWAQSKDGFISKYPVPKNRTENMITGTESQKLVHEWRSHEMAIMVGTNTAIADDPELTVRLAYGKNPLRVVVDRDLRIPKGNKIFNANAKTLLFTQQRNVTGYNPGTEIISEYFDEQIEEKILQHLWKKKISSLIIEGGQITLNHFIEKNLFDEARVFYSEKIVETGVKAPLLNLNHSEEKKVGDDLLKVFYQDF
ncbi:MAG: bifunctional diaminohydroxyphosphoribosylaminopyrimidine deaminase/5-amino-6-(5-phosphoribosylamino)uracil reductase RibD [Bacteroidia bacterium]|nr:bifunctional diaminohydroxyphosphoribosylaminopyrimidine deaminase/5-amino-6-(5-phosphoribosylamino)uracil reductase RibD [Bacteroidia bacterium]